MGPPCRACSRDHNGSDPCATGARVSPTRVGLTGGGSHMSDHAPDGTARSRRALLVAAAGSAAALAATAIAAPGAVLGHDVDDVQKEVDNPTTARTSITNS